jgi:pantothenate kinase
MIGVILGESLVKIVFLSPDTNAEFRCHLFCSDAGGITSCFSESFQKELADFSPSAKWSTVSPGSLKYANIASMGTGVAFTLNGSDIVGRHIGESALGGGTLVALSRRILGIIDFAALAATGTTSNVDLLISEFVGEDYGDTLKLDVVASLTAKAALFEKRPADKDVARRNNELRVCWRIS